MGVVGLSGFLEMREMLVNQTYLVYLKFVGLRSAKTEWEVHLFPIFVTLFFIEVPGFRVFLV